MWIQQHCLEDHRWYLHLNIPFIVLQNCYIFQRTLFFVQTEDNMNILFLQRLVFILNFLHFTHAMFDWSQAKNQTYLEWYLKYHREYRERGSTDAFPNIVNKLRQLVKEHENQSKTVPVEMNYIQYYPGESDVIIAVTNGGKFKPKSLPTRRKNYCKIEGYTYWFTNKICKLYRAGAMYR